MDDVGAIVRNFSFVDSGLRDSAGLVMRSASTNSPKPATSSAACQRVVD